MISARALSYLSPGTKERLRSGPGDRPLGIQLLGKDPYYLLKALERLENYSFDTLDFNAACPLKKIVNNGKGTFLLKEPKKLLALLKCLIKHTDKPVTLKMRLGWDSAKDALKIALGAEDIGVSAICVHGRTKIQGFREGVDYKAIAKIKKALKIPIIGSGDILSPELAKKMLNETGVDAIAVARGALGNPWLIQEIKGMLRGKIVPRPDILEITQMMRKHLDLNLKHYGERTGIVRFRKFYIWYTRGFTKVQPLRAQITQISTKKGMDKLIQSLAQIAP
ncbi:MAG: tRNA-dihydrouridine synthase, partial [Candidatus Omnitrophota bacterium]